MKFLRRLFGTKPAEESALFGVFDLNEPASEVRARRTAKQEPDTSSDKQTQQPAAERLSAQPSLAGKNVWIERSPQRICVVMKKAHIDEKLRRIDPDCFGSDREKKAKIAAFAGSFAEMSEDERLAHLVAVREGTDLVHEYRTGKEVFDSPPAEWDVPCYMVTLVPGFKFK